MYVYSAIKTKKNYARLCLSIPFFTIVPVDFSTPIPDNFFSSSNFLASCISCLVSFVVI